MFVEDGPATPGADEVVEGGDEDSVGWGTAFLGVERAHEPFDRVDAGGCGAWVWGCLFAGPEGAVLVDCGVGSGGVP